MRYQDALKLLYQEYDSFSRLAGLLELRGQVRDKTWLRLLGHVWDTCDNISAHWMELWDCLDPMMCDFMAPNTNHIPAMMNKKEQAFLKSLPERITIYRGCGPMNRWGWSWTLSREVAEQFPRLIRFKTDHPLLLTTEIDRSFISAVKLDREEQEVILFEIDFLGREAVKEEEAATLRALDFRLLFAYAVPVLDRTDHRRVYMSFQDRNGWHCQFLEADLKTSLPRHLHFKSPDKIIELVQRGGGFPDQESRLMLDQGIENGRGGMFLNLTEEQYLKLTHYR